MDEFKALTGIPIKIIRDDHFDHYDANDSDDARSGNYYICVGEDAGTVIFNQGSAEPLGSSTTVQEFGQRLYKCYDRP